MSTEQKPDVNADRQDPHDPNFCYTGKLIAYRRTDARGNKAMHWSRLYLPSTSAREWDKPPPETNVAIGIRVGFAYATITMTGRGLVKVPGPGYALGIKARVVWHNHDFDRGWDVSPPGECWIVTP